jgi:hypothetical protein
MLSAIMQNVLMLSIIMLNVYILSIIVQNVYSIIILNVLRLNTNMLSALASKHTTLFKILDMYK